MTNAQLADLLEEAARRLRGGVSTTVDRRASVEGFAARVHKSAFTVLKMCRDGKLIARRVGRDWQIDVEASEKALSLKYGNSAERDLARRR